MQSGCLRRSRIIRFTIVLSLVSFLLVFPKSWNRNLSHIPARYEYVLK